MQRLVGSKCRPTPATSRRPWRNSHPYIVRVYDQHLIPDRGLRLLYMQYVAGGTLQAVLEIIRQMLAAERSGQTLLGAVDKAVEERGESLRRSRRTRTAGRAHLA